MSSSELEKDVIEQHGPLSSNQENLDLTKQSSRASSRHSLKKTASNVLDRAISRLSTRNIKDPGPAPDGGLRAWTQVAALWTCSLTTW